MTPRSSGQRAAGQALCTAVRLLVGAYPVGEPPERGRQQIFFANHTSHLDTLTILAALDPATRLATRPVAARDYWDADAPRRWVAQQALNVVLIDRLRQGDADPLAPVHAALHERASLVIFPEGTRGSGDRPGPFKSGLHHLALAHPAVALVPVYLENLNRILPKGTLLPVPLINKVHFGAPLARIAGEPKERFLARARDAVCALAPAWAGADEARGTTS